MLLLPALAALLAPATGLKGQTLTCCDCRLGECTLFQWSGCEADPDACNRETLVTDRPDFTEASSTVGLGYRQLEIGYTYFFDDDGLTSTSVQSYPEALFRICVLRDWLEQRIAWTILDETVSAAGSRTTSVGSTDILLGAKIGLTPQCGCLPEMAIIPQMFVPTGSDEFTLNRVSPGLNWLYGWDVTDRWSLGGSTQGIRVEEDDGESYTQFAQSLTTGVGLTENVSGYFEWFALLPHSAQQPDSKPVYFLDGGFTWLLNDNLQYDIRAGVGLNDAAEDYFVGSGLALRF
jgi:hypothetical protein